jgi:hypothetical protein
MFVSEVVSQTRQYKTCSGLDSSNDYLITEAN